MRDDQSHEEPANKGDLVVQSKETKLMRQLTHKHKGKKKMSEYDIVERYLCGS